MDKTDRLLSSLKFNPTNLASDEIILPNYSGIKEEVRKDKDAKIKITMEGGLMIKLKNNTGAPSVKGYCVDITSVDGVALTTQNRPDCIGVFYESGVASGAYAWIVICGIAEVYFVGNTTAGHIARTFIDADADYETGKAKSEAVPTSPFATDKHFCEIGHVLETRTGAGLAKTILHFN